MHLLHFIIFIKQAEDYLLGEGVGLAAEVVKPFFRQSFPHFPALFQTWDLGD